TTRIPGLVSVVDVAPTALRHQRGSLSSSPMANPARVVRRLDRQIAANNKIKLPALLVVAAVIVALALLRSPSSLTAIPAARFGLSGYAFFALLAVVALADNSFGSDGGGAVVLGFAFALLGSRIAHLRKRGFAATLIVSAAVVLAMVFFDLSRPGPNHLRSVF